MSLINIIKTIREVEAFISESVSKSDEDGENPKQRKRLYSGLAVTVTLAFFLDLHTLAFDLIKITMAPPPRDVEDTTTVDQWSKYLEDRISKSLKRIYELEDLLIESNEKLRYSEQEREQLTQTIDDLQAELDDLRLAYEVQDVIDGDTLYDRLNSTREDK